LWDEYAQMMDASARGEEKGLRGGIHEAQILASKFYNAILRGGFHFFLPEKAVSKLVETWLP